jgi:hypothetical protein
MPKDIKKMKELIEILEILTLTNEDKNPSYYKKNKPKPITQRISYNNINEYTNNYGFDMVEGGGKKSFYLD